MAKKDTTSLGFEEKIWKAADALRGNLNASEYESVVLGLIFLKYISDKFEMKYQELLADEDADEDDKKINLFETFKQKLDWTDDEAFNNIRVI